MFAQRRAKDVCASFSFLCSLLLLPSGKDHKANTEHSRLIRSLIFMNAYESVIIIMMCVCLRTSPVQNCLLSFLSYVSLREESAAGGTYTHTLVDRERLFLYIEEEGVFPTSTIQRPSCSKPLHSASFLTTLTSSTTG